jgi:hypothetical protein
VVFTLGFAAVDVKERIVVPLPTVKVWKFWVAAFQLTFPAWLAFTLQVPAVWNETTPDAIEQTADDAPSMVNATTPVLVEVAAGV